MWAAPVPETLLILGGTAEARALADAAVARWPGLRVITALAGRTETPLRPAGELSVGGFGGAEGLADFVRGSSVAALVDATHPFAAEISRNAAHAARQTGVPRLVLCRAPWEFPPGSGVEFVRSISAAKSALETRGRRIFLAIGRKEINQFNALQDRFFLFRFVDLPDAAPPFAQHKVVTGRPGGRDEEEELLRSNRIDLLVAKNGGSDASRAKIDAAIALGIPAVLIDPPEPPPPPRVDTVAAALAWIAETLGLSRP